MTTEIGVTLPADHAADAEVVFAVFRHVEDTANEWKDGSPLAAVNHAAGLHPVAIPPDLRALLQRGIQEGEETDGAFDITWGALWGAWDFRAEHPRVPSDAELAPRLRHIDFHKVRLDPGAGTAFLPDKGMVIGLGGIAKGWALDQAARALRAVGDHDFTLSAGGQVLVAGNKDGRPWRVGIRDPRGEPTDFFASLEASDTSLSTSGDYERYFLLDGVRYHHILDPHTGRPTRGLRSATVICADATRADALSTALMVLGSDRGLALAERLQGVEAVLVDDQGRVLQTRGAHVELDHDPK